MFGLPHMDSQAALGLAVGLGCGFAMGWMFRARRLTLTDVSSKLNSNIFTDSGDYKMVLIVRTDLKMGKGKIAAQSAHAAVDLCRKLLAQNPQFLRKWESMGQPKIVLKAEDEQTLLDLHKQARKIGLPATVIQDAGRTQIAPGTKTVLGVGPGPAEVIDSVTGHLKLF